MNPDLKAVVEVQQLDQQVAELTALINTLPKQIQTLQSQLDNFISSHEERKKRLTANLKERKDLEGDIKATQDKILEKMVESEEIQGLVQEAASRLDGEKARVAAEIKKLETERQKDIDAREEVQARRKEVAASLKEEVLELYERIRSYRAAPAVAEVRNGLCTACNIQLRPQVYNEIRLSEAVMVCENCSRIQYYTGPPAEDPALAGGDGTRVSMS